MESYSFNSLPGLFRSSTVEAEERLRASSLEDEVLSIFQASRIKLLRYAVSFGLSRDDAEDLVQEVFVALFRHLRLGRSRSNLQGWVFRVTHNLALKRRGHLGSEKRWVSDGEDNVEHCWDPSPNPEAQLLGGERRHRLLGIFNALPMKDQWCLRLRAEGLRYREISQVVEMSLGSVSASLTRSLERLASVDR